jgi:DNA replication protein DnaC
MGEPTLVRDLLGPGSEKPTSPQPQPKLRKCLLCGKQFVAPACWFWCKWTYPTVHVACADEYDRQNKIFSTVPMPFKVGRNPGTQLLEFKLSKFNQFDPKLAEPRLKTIVEDWEDQRKAGKKNLLIIGPPGKGKSRVMHTLLKQLAEYENTKIDSFYFPEVALDFDRGLIKTMERVRNLFLDDIGTTESYGQMRASVQNVLRTRLARGRPMYLTVDNLEFDRDLFGKMADSSLVYDLFPAPRPPIDERPY